MTTLSLFYNYRAIGDVIVLISDTNSNYDHQKTFDNVTVLYDEDENVAGINIFDTMKLIKIKVNGLVHTLNKPIKDLLVNLVKSKTDIDIDISEHKYILGKIVDINNKNFLVDIGEESVITPILEGLNIDDYVIVSRPYERLEDGEMTSEVSSTGYLVIQQAENASDDDIGCSVYSNKE